MEYNPTDEELAFDIHILYDMLVTTQICAKMSETPYSSARAYLERALEADRFPTESVRIVMRIALKKQSPLDYITKLYARFEAIRIAGAKPYPEANKHGTINGAK